ncbi:glycosyl hydrolase 53 family protein [Paenibacillus alkalitolerans]|uniref:glycosyl hydrolase 53 family protein n=1 Tax=Paenibacillus alkalitolerans TaxID=2799335 RepID=UPI001F27AC46|nr:glycosyl hydrolase 53 family protein [Paenibacillus alkalitolerans]
MRKVISVLAVFIVLLSQISYHPAAEVQAANPAIPATFIRGADISTLQAVEDHGGKFYDNGVERDLLDILKDRGVNYIRLRLWNDPREADGYNDKAHVIELAKRVKAKGFKLLLDFHYSDFWADPGKQTKPEAWANLTYDELKQAVYDYTKEVITELKQERALPDMVQIGNEINSGILWPDGKSWGQDNAFDKLVPLLDSGVQGVKDSLDPDEDVKIMIHLAEGGKNGTFRWFFDELTKRHLEYDVIGLSYYPYWHGTLDELQYNMNDISVRYDKQVVVAETAYPHTLDNGDNHGNIIGLPSQIETGGFPATVQGQAAAVKAVMNAVLQVPEGKGAGIFYWEPAWIPVEGAGWKSGEGNAWENQAMFDFQGNALPSLDVFRPAPPAAPEQLTAEPSGRAAIDLQWTQVEGATGYNVYRADSKNEEYVRVNESALTEASFHDSRLNAGRVYYYRVSAVNAGGESERSGAVSVTTNPGKGN